MMVGDNREVSYENKVVMSPSLRRKGTDEKDG